MEQLIEMSGSCSLNGADPGSAAVDVLRALEAAGLEAWIVGGWVRDALMGSTSHDVDICCSGSWQESAAACRAAGLGVVESGTRFGGITAVAHGERVEVTQYRLDGFYTDGRHPDAVEPASCVEDDLARRDFTVNAMAWHPDRGLLDLYDGQGDLACGLIRAVGEPRRRFEEDSLRMLRAVRFACRLDFEVEARTAAALAACAPLLDQVARERVGAELDGILLTGRGGRALLQHPDLMCAAVPELAASRGFDQHSRYHAYDVYEHTARVLAAAGERELSRCAEGLAERPSRSLMWAALLHDVAKPATFTIDGDGRGHFYGHPALGAKMARQIMQRLGCPRDLVRDACLIIRFHDRPIRCERSDILGVVRSVSGAGADTARLMDELWDIKRADTLGKAESCFYYVDEIERMRTLTHELLAGADAYSVKGLAISGRDLVDAGLEPGPRVGELLEQALSAHIAGEVPNERTALLAYLGL